MTPTGWGTLTRGAMPRGAPCVYCKEDIVAGKIAWGQVNPAREQMSPPRRGSSTGLKGCHRQQFPALKCVLKSYLVVY